MGFKTLILLFVIVFTMACKQKPDKEENRNTIKAETVRTDKASDYLIDWVDAVNNNTIHALEKIYASNAVMVVSVDSIIENSSQIANYYGLKKYKIIAIESLFNVEASKGRGIKYELIRYKTEDLKEYIQIIIWRSENGKVIREFEFTERSNPEAKEVDIDRIADRRELWVELCNANNAENLIKQLYTANPIYFNHKPLVKGLEDLNKEYSYMNNDNYKLNLQPIKLEVVNTDFAFEIGQCSGSYNGKYILVWKKQADGNWKIHIDSNI